MIAWDCSLITRRCWLLNLSHITSSWRASWWSLQSLCLWRVDVRKFVQPADPNGFVFFDLRQNWQTIAPFSFSFYELVMAYLLSHENEQELCSFCRFSGIIIRAPNRSEKDRHLCRWDKRIRRYPSQIAAFFMKSEHTIKQAVALSSPVSTV